MKTLSPQPAHAKLILRALHAVALADGALDPRERRYLEMHGEAFGTSADPATLPPISPEELADQITDPEERAALVQRLVVMTMLDAEIRPEELALLRAMAQALEVKEHAICHMQAFVKGRMRLLAFDFGRRSFVGKQVRAVWKEQGLRGAYKLARGVMGLADPALAARYQALSEYPEDSLGRVFFEHCRGNGFKLPGEPKGTPEFLLFHDLGHALTGHDTSPAGEVAMAGFEAGYMGEDGFSVMLLALFAFHLGAPIIPAGYATGQFDLDVFQAACQRGRAMRTDLRKWDPWPLMDRPLMEVREQLGVSTR